MLAAVIFDLDGVIIDSERLVDAANVAFLKGHGCTYNRDAYKPLAMGKTLAEGVKIMQDLFGLAGSAENLVEQRREIIARLYWGMLEFVPGFVVFFSEVSRRGLQCGVATSATPELLGIARQKLSLDRLFPERIFTTCAVGGKSKPDPDLYLYAASRLGVAASGCVVIEDAPLGIEAARRAGMKCIAITTTLGREFLLTADLVVSSFSEIDLDALPFA